MITVQIAIAEKGTVELRSAVTYCKTDDEAQSYAEAYADAMCRNGGWFDWHVKDCMDIYVDDDVQAIINISRHN